MGWCRGDALCATVLSTINLHPSAPPYPDRIDLFADIIVAFEDMDMDCYDAISDVPGGLDALKHLYPEWFD